MACGALSADLLDVDGPGCVLADAPADNSARNLPAGFPAPLLADAAGFPNVGAAIFTRLELLCVAGGARSAELLDVDGAGCFLAHAFAENSACNVLAGFPALLLADAARFPNVGTAKTAATATHRQAGYSE